MINNNENTSDENKQKLFEILLLSAVILIFGGFLMLVIHLTTADPEHIEDFKRELAEEKLKREHYSVTEVQFTNERAQKNIVVTDTKEGETYKTNELYRLRVTLDDKELLLGAAMKADSESKDITLSAYNIDGALYNPILHIPEGTIIEEEKDGH